MKSSFTMVSNDGAHIGKQYNHNDSSNSGNTYKISAGGNVDFSPVSNGSSGHTNTRTYVPSPHKAREPRGTGPSYSGGLPSYQGFHFSDPQAQHFRAGYFDQGHSRPYYQPAPGRNSNETTAVPPTWPGQAWGSQEGARPTSPDNFSNTNPFRRAPAMAMGSPSASRQTMPASRSDVGGQLEQFTAPASASAYRGVLPHMPASAPPAVQSVDGENRVIVSSPLASAEGKASVSIGDPTPASAVPAPGMNIAPAAAHTADNDSQTAMVTAREPESATKKISSVRKFITKLKGRPSKVDTHST